MPNSRFEFISEPDGVTRVVCTRRDGGDALIIRLGDRMNMVDIKYIGELRPNPSTQRRDLNKVGTTSPLFQKFLDDIRPLFSQTLGKLQTLIQVTASESSKYGDDSPINDDYFKNPAIQNAIKATHFALKQVLVVSQKYVKDYDQLICQQTVEVGKIEGNIMDHRKIIASLSQTRTSLQNIVSSLQESNDHTRRQLAAVKNELDSERRDLEATKERQNISMPFPFFGEIPIGRLLVSDQELRDMQDKVDKLQDDMQSHEQSKDRNESRLLETINHIATTENASRNASAQLKEFEAALGRLKSERFLILQFEEKLKNSAAFLQNFYGKVDVLYQSNCVTMLFESIIDSLIDLLIFLNQNLANQLAILAPAQDLETIHKLLNMKKLLARP